MDDLTEERIARLEQVVIMLQARVQMLERGNIQHMPVGGVTVPLRGCVCPAGAEQNCASPGCPRRNPLAGVAFNVG